MSLVIESAAIHRASSAIESALKLLDQLDPADAHFFIKADLENALVELRACTWIPA